MDSDLAYETNSPSKIAAAITAVMLAKQPPSTQASDRSFPLPVGFFHLAGSLATSSFGPNTQDPEDAVVAGGGRFLEGMLRFYGCKQRLGKIDFYRVRRS